MSICVIPPSSSLPIPPVFVRWCNYILDCDFVFMGVFMYVMLSNYHISFQPAWVTQLGQSFLSSINSLFFLHTVVSCCHKPLGDDRSSTSITLKQTLILVCMHVNCPLLYVYIYSYFLSPRTCPPASPSRGMRGSCNHLEAGLGSFCRMEDCPHCDLLLFAAISVRLRNH